MSAQEISVAKATAAAQERAAGERPAPTLSADRGRGAEPDAVKVTVSNILCVTTDPLAVKPIGQAFRHERFALRCVADAKQLLEALAAQAPDLLIVDLDLGPPAIELLKAIRARPLSQHTPLFALARPVAQAEMVAAMAAGATEITLKPLVPVALVHRARHALRESQMFQRWRQDLARRRHIDAAHPDLTLLVDSQGKVIEVVTVGRLPSVPNVERLVGKLVDDWLPRPEDGTLGALCATAIRGGGARETEIRIDGITGPVTLDCAVSSAGPGRALLVAREIDARQLGYEKNPVSTGARFDVLTGLPNRQSFAQRLNDRLPKHGTDHKMAVFRININQFAEISNLLGTGAAEELMKGLAERLLTLTERGNGVGASMLGTMASVGRLDADALGVMTSGVRSRTDCFTVVERLRRLLEMPVVHDGRELRSTFAIGISIAPGDGLEAETLMRAAAVAAASASADEGARIYSKTLQVQSLRRLDLENHLRRAINNRELKLHYQPKVDLKTHSVVGFEALLRWHSTEFGNISPLEIIPLAEQTGLIAPMGEWVIEQACTDLGLWRADGFPVMTVAVNVSAEQFHATDMNALASRAIKAAGIPANALELELTESCLMRDHRRAMVVFGLLRDLGCHLSIDDFGTGYSSLQYLRRLPVHSLKIDRSFVKDLPGDTGALAICRTVIALGRSLNLEVVAEGVETIDQAETVARRGATQAQGYLLAKPMKGEDVLPWLKRGEWRTTLAEVTNAGATRQLQQMFRDPFQD